MFRMPRPEDSESRSADAYLNTGLDTGRTEPKNGEPARFYTMPGRPVSTEAAGTGYMASRNGMHSRFRPFFSTTSTASDSASRVAARSLSSQVSMGRS